MTKLPALLALALGACTSSSGSTDISTAPLAGTVYGQPWTFKAASTDFFLSKDSDTFFVNLYSSAYTPCKSMDPQGAGLIVELPKMPGDYPMSLSRNLTFTDGHAGNKIATEGRIVVSTVTPTMITGGLHATFDGQNEVDGQFTVTVCTE